MKPNMIKKWSIALLVAAGAVGLTGCEGMRVDEGASTATNSGNITDRNVLKANLSGTVVDDFGQGLSGVKVYSYGLTTTTDTGGNWILNNVPVTGVNINSTPQNLEQTTDVVSQGKIYISYNRTGYAEYRSSISNPAVVTHYGTAGGNPNSIIVDGLMASEAIQLPQLINTITGVVVDKGSYYTGAIGEYAMAGNMSVRLIPATDVVNNAYDSAATTCYEGCGFYSVGEIQSTTDANGKFEFKNVPKIPGGYIMRVDDPKYRPMARPNDGTGFSYDYDAGTTSTLANADSTWGVSVQAHENQNYWWGIDFDVKTQSGSNTYLDSLYVGDFLVAASNTVEGITVGGKFGHVDENSGDIVNDGHNGLPGNAVGVQSNGTDSVVVDSNLVDLGTIPLKLVFSGDMIPHAAGEIPARGIVVFDSAGTELAWSNTVTSVSGRTLTLQLQSTPAAGRTIYVRLHRDVFADMSGQRLNQTDDPNQADFSGAGGPQGDADANTNGNGLYTEYVITYTDPLITADPVANVANLSINRAIPLTASLGTAAAATTSFRSVQASDGRVEELVDAILVKTGSTAANVDGPNDHVTFDGQTADITFTAVNGGNYRVTALDDNGVSLTLAAAGAAINENSGATTIATLAIGGTANTTGSTFQDFTAAVGSATTDPTATVRLTGVSAGFKITIARINDFGDVVSASASQTVTLADDFEPHVAIQNSNYNGQDTTFNGAAVPGVGASGAAGAINSANTAEMLYQCGIETSDDNGEAEVGDAAYYFPKLNLSASLYDKFNLRAHTEVASPDDLLSTAMDHNQAAFGTQADSSAEDRSNAVTAGTLLSAAYNTPLLATTAATEAAAGTTTSGRNDQYYTAADYSAWGLVSTTSAAPACTYYMADLNNVTGAFSGNWYPSNAAGTPSSVVAVSDDDGSMTTVPPALDNYTITGTYTQALAGGGNAPGNILKEDSTKTGCDAGASSSYDFDRTVVLNMTEAVSAPADLAAFKAQTGVCGQTNIVSGSELDNSSTGITKVSGPSSGFNNDHLLLTFGDWRTIDDSNHFTSNTEAGIANSAFDGSSGNDLMQIVSVQDASGLAATAGNGRGVLIVDATPALATKMTASGSTAGSSLTIGFDQTISTGDNGEDDNNRAADEDTEFEIQGDGVNYTFDFTDNDGVGAANPASGSNAWTVTRSTDYVDRFGNVVTADNRLDITLAATTNTDSNVPGGMANSLFTITMVDPSTSTGDNDADTDGGAATTDADNVDYTDFFAELSHASAASAAATSGTTPSFYLDYRDLEDNSFNSWRNVETFDQYDGTNEPRLVGADSTVPRLQTVAYANMDVDATFLLQDTSGIISLSAAHASAAGDPDIIYTPGTDTSYIGGATEDASVNNLWGYSATVANGESNASRLVFKFAVPSGAAVDMTQALAFIYLPTNEQVSDTANIANVVVTTTALTAGGFGRESAGGLAGSVGQVDSDGDAAYTDEVNVVVELPDYEVSKAVNIASTDLLVLQNLIINDVSYSVHINAPAISTAAPNASETAHGLTTTVYRHVFLDNSDMVGNNNGTAGAAGIQVGASFTSAAPRFSGELTFREELAAATTANVVFSTTNAVDDDTAAFNGTTTTTDEVVSLSTTAGAAEVTDNSITFTLDALSAGSVTETLSKVVGRNSVLTVTATDHSAQTSTTTITLKKGHGQLTINAGGTAEQDKVILNTISGNSIDNL